MPDNNSNYGVALYYPYINIQNMDWLKCCLLYWDAIRCIVPESITDHYLNDELNMLFDQQLLVSTAPDDYRDKASVKFIKYFLPYLQDFNSFDSQVLKFFAKKHTSISLIHEDKVSHRLIKEMGNKIIIQKHDQWIETKAYVSGLYMMCLASEMGENICAPLLTDVPEIEKIGQYLIFGEPINDLKQPGDSTDLLLKLDLSFPHPKDLEHVSFDDVIQFCKNRRDEKIRFRTEIESIRQTVKLIDDPNALCDYLNEKKKDISISITEHRKSFKDIGISDLNSLINISCPAVVSNIANTLSDFNNDIKSIITVSGFALSAFLWWSSNSKLRQSHKQTCPYHYLQSLEEEYLSKI